ncbi:hypothetical protein FB645_004856 [Coemansia sp. IMI 203386]|nr:hypothetical protein FB645_004856 [Coemansia sp. IMI 203386]
MHRFSILPAILPLLAAAQCVLGLAAGSDVVDDARAWRFSGAMLSEARSSIAATSAGHMAFFAGGRLQNGSYSDVVDIYDRRANAWSAARLSVGRSSIGAGSLAGRYALFAGGLDDAFRPMTVVDVFDTQTGAWSTLALHTPRGSPHIVDLGSTAAIVGGLSGDLQYLSRAVDYVSADLKVTNATLNDAYPQFGLVIGDSAGGVGLLTAGYQNNRPGDRFNDFQASNQTTVFTVAEAGSAPSVTASAGPPFPYPRWGAGGAAANGVFAVGGGHVFDDAAGETQTTVVDRVDVYSSRTGQWSSAPLKLSMPRDYPLVQAVGDYIVFLGGTDQTKDIDVLDTRSGAFVAGLGHTPALYTLRTDAAATTVDDCLLIVAGGLVYQGRNATASVEMFDACK